VSDRVNLQPDADPDADAVPAGDFLVDSDVVADATTPGRYHVEMSSAWKVFYLFGGMTMACALRAVQRELDRDDFVPLTANALFVQPVSPGPVEIDVQVLRSGRTAGQAVADLRNTHHDGTALHLTAAFGQLHESSIDYLDATFPDVPMPDDCQPPPPRPDDSPFANINFHEQTDWRPTTWWDPADWQPAPAVASAWTRLVKEPRLPDGTIDPVSLCIPADTLGMAIGQRVGPDPFFILTLEIGLQFLGPTESPWLLQHVRAPYAADGYGTGSVELWDVDRRLIAFATQRARLRTVAPGERLGPS
jgi:acyl-CoA thioesterase